MHSFHLTDCHAYEIDWFARSVLEQCRWASIKLASFFTQLLIRHLRDGPWFSRLRIGFSGIGRFVFFYHLFGAQVVLEWVVVARFENTVKWFKWLNWGAQISFAYGAYKLLYYVLAFFSNIRSRPAHSVICRADGWDRLINGAGCRVNDSGHNHIPKENPAMLGHCLWGIWLHVKTSKNAGIMHMTVIGIALITTGAVRKKKANFSSRLFHNRSECPVIWSDRLVWFHWPCELCAARQK